MLKKKPVVAIDGPAGSGKSTLGKKLAHATGLLYIDTGAMYRAFGLKCLRNNVPPENLKMIEEVLEDTEITLKQDNDILKVYLDGSDVTSEIRTPEAGKAASIYSALSIVRKKMIDMQRKIGRDGGVVMDGRDIGTVVFPGADLKIYLDASAEIRSIRRFREIYGKEPDKNSDDFKSILRQQKERDRADMARESSPLKAAEDAVVIDSSTMDLEAVFNFVMQKFEQLNSK